MADKFSDEQASRIIAALDARNDRKVKDSAQITTTWATIGAVDAANKSASAYLYGETDGAYMSGGFRIPETMYLSVGDKVKVAINYATGDRWIAEALYPATTYKKLAFDIKNGQVLTGDGTVPPVASSGVPTGSVVAFTVFSTIPSGWLKCDGSAVSRSTYSALFNTIGTAFGVGDGSTTFNLPNLQGRVIVGLNGADASFDTMGETGGAKTHTHAGHSAHVVTQPAAHSNHVFTQPSAHAALAHSAHTGTAVSAHSGGAVSAHAVHTHETPFIDDDTHTLSTTSAVFGQGASRTRAWTGSFSSASGSYPVAQVSDTTVSAHTFTQPSAHTVTDPSAHSDHASQSHSGGAVDAHSAHSGTAVDAHSAHDTPSSMNPYMALHYIIKT